MARTYVTGQQQDIPALWERFWARHAEVRDAIPGVCYGLCVPGAPASGGTGPATFEYTACVGVGSSGVVPDGMVERHVPAQRYLVFTHVGHVSGIAQTYDAIYRRWLPASGHRLACGPDFERYDGRFDGATASGEVDIYVPVE
jgi:AraC family transcriptional regulator